MRAKKAGLSEESMESKEVVVKQGVKLAKEAKSTQDKVRQAVDKN